MSLKNAALISVSLYPLLPLLHEGRKRKLRRVLYNELPIHILAGLDAGFLKLVDDPAIKDHRFVVGIDGLPA